MSFDPNAGWSKYWSNKPLIRRVGGGWCCGPSLHPRLGLGPAWGKTPKEAYEMWQLCHPTPVKYTSGKTVYQTHPGIWFNALTGSQ